MPHGPAFDALPQLLAGQGIDLTAEAGQTVLRWLRRDLAAGEPGGWPRQLSAAAALGLEVYGQFMTEFNAFYEDSDAKGPALVAKALRRNTGRADPHMAEAVLDRIRNRRLHLLDSFRRKYQPSLLGPRTFDAGKVRGYLVRVARFESLHVPTGDQPWKVARLINPAALADPATAAGEPGPNPRQFALQVRAFWGPENGFTEEQRLEGLVSLGLGFLTGEAEVEQRCRAVLEAKLPAWETTAARLRRRASEWLARWETGQYQLSAAGDAAERGRLGDRLNEIEERLARLRARLARHPAKLRPRPAEVAHALAGRVANVGNARFRRIGREIALFEDRVQTGRKALVQTLAGRLPAEMSQLLAEVGAHLAERPASPRGHGLSAEERAERVRQAAVWQARAADLLDRVRGTLRLFIGFPLPAAVGEPILGWLADAEDLYELGLLQRKGVIAGLGRRHGWRLEHLLRVPSSPGVPL